ncbi:MAG: hypothetical protein ACM3ZF_13260 [Mycobacterium leprae]
MPHAKWLRMPAATVNGVLRREGMPRLTEIDLVTRGGERGRAGKSPGTSAADLASWCTCQSSAHPGLGRSPGTRTRAQHPQQPGGEHGPRGQRPAHRLRLRAYALDDHSRLVDSEVLADETAGHHGGPVAAGDRLVRRARHPDQAGADRQRLRLPLPRLGCSLT